MRILLYFAIRVYLVEHNIQIQFFVILFYPHKTVVFYVEVREVKLY